MKKMIILTGCLLGAFVGFAQSEMNSKDTNVLVSVARYRGDKTCAISYTFDDGLKEHYTLVAPKFKELGFKGTFWINGSKINKDENAITDTTRMTWENLKQMSHLGHEVSNHGWAHKNFGRHTLEEIREDIYKNDSAIFVNIGMMPRTFCYPNNTKTREGLKIASENRVGTRTVQRSVGGKSTSGDLEKWVHPLLDTRDWGITMTHGITYGYDHFKSADILWAHLQKVKAMEDQIWVGTFQEVAAYTKERDNIRFDVVKKKRSMIVTPHLTLDQELFTEPLTMVVKQKGGRKVQVKQEGKKLPVTIRPDQILFNFNPHGGPIQVDFRGR